MEMRDDKITVGHLAVERHSREHDPRQAADDEQKDKPGNKQQGRAEHAASAQHGNQPREDLNAARDADDYAGDAKQLQRQRRVPTANM